MCESMFSRLLIVSGHLGANRPETAQGQTADRSGTESRQGLPVVLLDGLRMQKMRLVVFFAEAFTQAKMAKLGLPLPREYGSDLTYSNRVISVVDKYFKREQFENIGKGGTIKYKKVILKKHLPK